MDSRLVDYSPLERILLMANGNLQRILQAYHNKAVRVVVHENKQTPLSRKQEDDYASDDLNDDVLRHGVILERKVDLVLEDEANVCTATSVVTIEDRHYADLMVHKSVSIGQLFALAGVLPDFELVECGRTDGDRSGAAFWRKYRLSAPRIDCVIIEHFGANILTLSNCSSPPSSSS
jgi:chorismate-pyruvate lyase